MDAWSLMRGDAFIHFVCGSRRVNIRLGVLLLIPKSPQVHLERTKTKKLPRGKYWFPKMNNIIGRIIDQCYECKEGSSDPRPKQIKPSYTQERLGAN